ncbi:MAG: molybdopterin dinucleotide binding domain-containing protein, partial [bacterium]
QVVNLLLLRGNIGREGAGACPVRGHSNVQGDRTMGIDHNPKPAFLEALERNFGFAPPRASGLDTVGAIDAMTAGRVRFFCAMGGNFVSASPDSPRVAEGLARSDLNVFVATKLNRSHLAVGRSAFLLPCLGRTEVDLQGGVAQRVTVEDSMSMVHASAGRNTPASTALRSEPAIVAGIGAATRATNGIAWEALVADYEGIRDVIEAVFPALFSDFNARIDTPGGFYLGNSAREREWKTTGGRAQFTAEAIPDQDLPAGQLRLMTLRSHDQFNTTIYADDDRYRGVVGTRQVIFLNAADLEAKGLTDGAAIDVESHFGDGETRIVRGFRALAYDIPPGCAAGYFPELNPLVARGSFARGSRTPTSKFVPVTIQTAT